MKAFIGLLARSESFSFLFGDDGGDRNNSDDSGTEGKWEGDATGGEVLKSSGGKLNL
jgi:hypothetical protein